MKKLLFLSFIMFMLIAMNSCEKDEVYTSSDQEMLSTRMNATVPFRGEYNVHTVVYEPCESYETAFLDADGKALHLGNSTWESCTTLDFTSDPMPNDCTEEWGLLQIGSMIFTAADGSQLIGSYAGIFDDGGGCGDYLITHGNGRFEGATGEGVYQWIDNPDGPNPLVFEGTLTNP
jgi:hypothetical protein